MWIFNHHEISHPPDALWLTFPDVTTRLIRYLQVKPFPSRKAANPMPKRSTRGSPETIYAEKRFISCRLTWTGIVLFDLK
jgi:hypothetical protein